MSLLRPDLVIATLYRRAMVDAFAWSVVIPVFNEASFLPATLQSLVAQSDRASIIIVDNGSTDGGVPSAIASLTPRDRAVIRVLDAPQPGQVHALRAGIEAATGQYIAICDADTLYPPHYLQTARALFEAGDGAVVATAAWLRPAAAPAWRQRLAAWHRQTAMQVLPWQNHTSGAAQCFLLSALRRAGGYDAQLWPYVLKDHELMNRVLQFGRQSWHPELWCESSDRRADRRGVRWTLGERLLYHATPFRWQHAFFHRFLGPRLSARGMRDTVLRDRPWDGPARPWPEVAA